MDDLAAYKKVGLEAVLAAEERILHYFHHLPKVEKKADMTPVTQADKEAEAIIIETIKKHFPEHGFLGEEHGADNESAEFQWIIDPIDGTKNFIRGLEFYGTVLSLKHNGRIIVGISNMPSLKELLVATSDEYTTLNGKEVSVSAVDTLSDAFVSMGGFARLQDPVYHDAVTTIERQTMHMRGFGDTHGYHLVATGRADAMFEPGVKPWDVSAYQLIIKQAGGMYSDFSGNELALGPSSLATNGHLHEQLIQLLKRNV